VLRPADFLSNAQKLVIILTYQRCGSSFFGHMFNSNPSVFYMFEPLDALYSSLYGTMSGWNVPSDITSFSNGSHRSTYSAPSFCVDSVLYKIEVSFDKHVFSYF